MTIDAEILSALRQTRDGYVSGADLAQRLGISRAAIWARIEDLRRLGYDIEASPHKGYRLLGMPDVLHADDLMSRLGETRVIGRVIQVFEETNSTNDLAERLARDGAKEGAVVIAESQTKGRGRMGRVWVSPPRQGLWLSVLLRPALPPQAATQITIAAATALSRAIRQVCALRAEIKWPNDILFRGRKAAGILTELSADLDQIKQAVVGVGVDVNLAAADFPVALRKTATSLRIECGQPVSRAELATAFLRELDQAYALICDQQFERLADEWMQQCSTIGQPVRIQVGGRTVFGRAEALDSDGALLVRAQHGHLERITGGDVILEK
ncbi:MAG: biotin--[acetyl-CoA-carboxylase] ligase [Verrucomicrobiota bacterium]